MVKLKGKVKKTKEKEAFMAALMASADVSVTPRRKLFEHQIEGISRMLAVPDVLQSKGMILADDMGLGKTMQATIAAYERVGGKGAILVICPATLKLNWQREINSVYPGSKVIVSDKDFFCFSSDREIIWHVVNYDVLEKFSEEILSCNFDCLVVDESHYIKNGKLQKNVEKDGTVNFKYSVKRTHWTLKIAEKVPSVYLLTGTPFSSRPLDGWNQLVAINHPITQKMSFNQYKNKYCNQTYNGYGYTAQGASNLEDLHEKLGPSVLRRLKEDVLDLPEKMRVQIPVKIDLKEYIGLEKELVEMMKKKGASATIGILAAMKACTGRMKVPYAVELIEDIIESGNHVILSSCYTTCLDSIQKSLEHSGIPFVRIDGSVSLADRQKAVDTFQNSKDPMVFLGQIHAAGVGITLTRSTNLIFLDLDWVPGNMCQMEDRQYRIGQKNNCTVHYLLAQGTMDNDLCARIIEKLNNIETILTGVSVEESEESIMKSMIDALAMKYGL